MNEWKKEEKQEEEEEIWEMRKGMGVGWFDVGNPAVNVVLVVLGVQNVQKKWRWLVHV